MYPETLTLEVTQDHINDGTPKKFQHCPIALAMRGRGFKGVVAGSTWIWLSGSKQDNGTYPIDTRYYPIGTHREEMEAWVHAFDEGEGVEPITLVFQRS